MGKREGINKADLVRNLEKKGKWSRLLGKKRKELTIEKNLLAIGIFFIENEENVDLIIERLNEAMPLLYQCQALCSHRSKQLYSIFDSINADLGLIKAGLQDIKELAEEFRKKEKE